MKKLNLQTASCNENWVINIESCGPAVAEQTCRAINTTDNIDNTRECLGTSSKSQETFQAIKNYFGFQESLMTNLINGLTQFTAETPYTKVFIAVFTNKN